MLIDFAEYVKRNPSKYLPNTGLGYHCTMFVFGKYLFHVLAKYPAVLTEVLLGFLQFLPATTEMES
jgi:hypothetical protein